MNIQQEKSVRFQDWNWNGENQYSVASHTSHPLRITSSLKSVSAKFQRGFLSGSERIKRFGNSFKSFPSNSALAGSFSSRHKILDPQGSFLQKWNKIFALSCLIAVSIDPLFFYVPVVDGEKKCLSLDYKMEITATVLRSFCDIFYIIHIIFQFRTGFIAPSSRVFGKGVLVKDTWAIARRYLSSYFWVDILSILPLPQVVILIVIPKLRGGYKSLNTKNFLKFVVFLQYVPRLLRVVPLYKVITRTSGIITETAWAGAAFNLFLFMLVSHVLGALWYLFSVEREITCWQQACFRNATCHNSVLYNNSTRSTDFVNYLNNSCPIQEANPTLFDFGIFLDALQSGTVESGDFTKKFWYSFWWGLRNLSSLGQNLKTSTYVWEIIFAVFISICGLVLFSSLVGNIQTYLQSTTTRLEEMRVKRRDAEQWMSHRLLPDNLRDRIRRYEQYKWQETRGVDEENLIRNLPKDLRRDIKRHLCLALLMRVPIFEKMDEQLLDAMCDRLKPVLYTDESCIVREGDPVDEMLFIIRGKLQTVTTNGGRKGFYNSGFLKSGDFCGEELLFWSLDPKSTSNLPISTRTVQTLVEVEAFSLKAEDLKLVACQFRRLHSKQLRHTFRFYSQQWQTWGACIIQAWWRRYSKKKKEEALREEENKMQDVLAEDGATSSSLGTTIYASTCAAKRLCDRLRKTRLPERFPPVLLQKPAEPDFMAE